MHFKLKPLITESKSDWFVFSKTINSCFENHIRFLKTRLNFLAFMINISKQRWLPMRQFKL